MLDIINKVPIHYPKLTAIIHCTQLYLSNIIYLPNPIQPNPTQPNRMLTFTLGFFVFLQRTNKKSDTRVTLPCSPLSPQLASSHSIHVGLNPGGVTCRRISEAQVSQSSQRVKSAINECVPLNDGVHVYL